MGLKEYQAKRNFNQTQEPAGKVRARRKAVAPRFVIQKHDATRLHYDFRLEMEGVLKSWAIPKGLPMQRGDRRLAVQVEDHPLDYADFEGTIPEGSYGAGTVMVWDTGTFQVAAPDSLKALEQGKLHLTLNGKKLKGDWTLVRMRPRDNENKPQWLILKSGTDLPPLSARAENRSVVSRRSLEQIAAHNDRQWESDRPASRTTRSSIIRKTRPRATPAGPRPPALRIDRLPKAEPGYVEPMKALLVEELPEGEQWVYEIKFDGVRALAIRNKGEPALLSRSAKDLTAKFPELASALDTLPTSKAVLDGEIVVLDDQGRSSFQLLQSYHMAGPKKPPLFYYVFDLINVDGKDLTGLPLLERKAMAEALIKGVSPMVRFSASIRTDSAELMREMQARGLEGLIAKRRDSKYEIGRRSGAWLKFKWSQQQEFVIGGYTRPRGTRTHFGAILVGYYERGQLRFAGKVGTGFAHKLLDSLFDRFQKLLRKDCPFLNLPEKPSAGGLTASQMKLCTWLEPKLVCQVRFAEWTRDGHLRQPAFMGLREDKKPKEVVREKPV